MVFGGWSDRWHDDIYTLDVGNIVGPPYAITDMLPKLGPVTGGTTIQIMGIDFINTADVVVRFGSRKQAVDARGTFVNQTKLTVVSPDYRKFGPGVVDVRVALDGDSFTTTFQKFTFFSITNAANCIMFGAGLLRYFTLRILDQNSRFVSTTHTLFVHSVFMFEICPRVRCCHLARTSILLT